MPQTYRLLYCSRNCIAGTPDDIAAKMEGILAVSRANNARDGLTGGLLFNAGCFVQVLEGPVSLVERTFERIQCDDRHEDLEVLEVGPIERRDFAAWSMAYAGLGDDPFAAIAIRSAFISPTAHGGRVLELMRDAVLRGGAKHPPLLAGGPAA